MNTFQNMTPNRVRQRIRQQHITGPTAGMCAGYAQANVVILPSQYAADFETFALRNPRACPLLEKLDAGVRFTRLIADGADVTRDVPQYRIYESGVLTRACRDIGDIWRDDYVTFLLGCSFTFEAALMETGIEMRHITQGRNVPMYKTSIPTEKAGTFEGPMVVSMRPIHRDQVDQVVAITSRYPKVHGAPVHIGSPTDIGIGHLDQPDYGDAVELRDGEVPVFWACGVTPQAACENARLSIMITHAPGHMFIADVRNDQLADLSGWRV